MRTLQSQGLEEPRVWGTDLELGCTGSGSPHLGLCHFLAGEHEEDIASVKQRAGQVQEGEVLA